MRVCVCVCVCASLHGIVCHQYCELKLFIPSVIIIKTTASLKVLLIFNT